MSRKQVAVAQIQRFLGRLLQPDRKTGLCLVVVGMVSYVVLLSLLGLRKHTLFQSTNWDLGIFNQAFWSTVTGHGFFFYTTEPYTNPSGSFFGIHFSPILLAVVPLYALYPSIVTLLVVQAAVLALGAIPLYLLSLLEIRRVRAALAISFSYLLYFPLQAANLFDFHVEAFFVTPILFSIYFLRTRRWGPFAIALTVALASIEYAAFLVISLGVALVLLNATQFLGACKSRRLTDLTVLVPLMTIALGVTWFAFASSVMASFNPSPPAGFTGAQNWRFIGANTILQIPAYVLLHPGNALQAVLYDTTLKLAYLLLLLAPLLFVPLREPRALVVSVPWIVFSFLSNYPPYYLVGFQYPLFVVPGFFWALVLGLRKASNSGLGSKRLFGFNHRTPRHLLTVSILSWLAFTVFIAPSVLRTENQHDLYLRRILQLVPADASILTQNNLFPHVSNRVNAHAIPIYLPAWAPIFQVLIDRSFGPDPDFILIDGMSDPDSASIASLWLRTSVEYGVYAEADGIILLKRGFQETPVFFIPIKVNLTYADLKLYDGTAMKDPEAQSGLSVYHPAGGSGSPIWFASSRKLVLPPGFFHTSIMVKSSAPIDENAMTLEIRVANGTLQLSSFRIRGSDLSLTNQWISLSFSFRLQTPESVQLNGWNATDSADLYLDFIEISQISP